MHAMTKRESKAELIDLKGLLERDEDFVRAAVEMLVQAALEAEMSEAIGAEKGERTAARLSYRSGYYSRSLVTRVGTLELRVPQDRAGRSSWRDFLLGLKQRGLFGVEFVVSDDHPGLKQAIREVLPEAAWQRCYVHFLRNALDYVPRKVDDDCLRELRWFYDRRELGEVRRDIAQWLAKW